MMKTQIVLCCDKCEEFLHDQYLCYGISDDYETRNDIYICQDCMNQIIDAVISDLESDFVSGRFHQYASYSNGMDMSYMIGNKEVLLFTISKIDSSNQQDPSMKYYLVTNKAGKRFLLVADSSSINLITENKEFFARIIKSNFAYEEVIKMREKFTKKKEMEEAYRKHQQSQIDTYYNHT